jgi:hypothetical protein
MTKHPLLKTRQLEARVIALEKRMTNGHQRMTNMENDPAYQGVKDVNAWRKDGFPDLINADLQKLSTMYDILDTLEKKMKRIEDTMERWIQYTLKLRTYIQKHLKT